METTLTTAEILRKRSAPELGLSAKDKKNYSISRAIAAAAMPADARYREAAAFELECAAEIERKMGSAAQGFYVPDDVLQRDMTVGTAADGGYLKGTDHRGDAFVDILRKKTLVNAMGASHLRGLVGDVAIPKMTAAHAAYWLSAEDSTVTESKATLSQVTLSPKTVGAMSEFSRQLLKQAAPSIDSLIINDLSSVLAGAVDLAALHGTGADGQPTGIAATTGIGSVAGGTDGLAPTAAHMVGLHSAVADYNADIGSLGYLTNAKVRGKLKLTFRNSTGGDTPIWENGSEPGFGIVNGYRAGCTNQVSSELTKGTSSGVCSGIFFGNWADLLIGFWGGLDVLVDPFSLSSKGWTRIVAFQSVDIAVRHPESFSVMLDALTT